MDVSPSAPPEAPAAGDVGVRWRALVIAALAMVATMPGRTHGLGLITEPLLRHFELSRVTYAQINFWATLLGSLFCFPAGWLLDRWAPRHVLAGVCLCLATVVLVMPEARGLWQLAVIILLTRGLGQSALSVVSLAIVGKAFPRRNGLAMGMYSVTIGLGFMAAFIAAGQALQTWNWSWQQLWSALGWGVLIVGIIGWVLTPDLTPKPQEQVAQGGAGATLLAALRSQAFWAFGISMSLYGMVAAGITLFYESVLHERGFKREVFLEVVQVTPLLALFFNMLGGWLGQRWSLAKLLGVAMLVLAGAMFALPRLENMTHVYLYAAAMAFAGGVVTVTFFSVWGRFYGTAHLGRIQGAAQAMTVLASALGPELMAWTEERTGSYALLFYVLAGLSAVLGIWLWVVPLPSGRGFPTSVCPPRQRTDG